MSRRLVLRALLPALFALSSLTPIAHAEYPDKPLRLIVPYPPGASADATARMVGQKVSELLEQSVIIDNRSGASGNIGTEYGARQPADGYTFMLGTDATHGTNYSLSKNPTFHPVKDFTPLALAAYNPLVLAVNANVPANTLAEYLEGVRNGTIPNTYGSSGLGSPHHLAGELLARRAGVKLVHVPYRGGGPALTDTMGGQIPALFASAITVIPHIEPGKLKALAVTDTERYPGLPNVPTVAETYEGFAMPSWLAFFAPAGLQPDVARRLSGAIVKALADKEIQEKLGAAGLVVPKDTSPDALADLQKRDMEAKGALIREAGISAE